MLKESRTWNERRVNELEEASSLLIGLLNETLDISKLEEGKLDLNMKFESIKNIVGLAVDLCESSASKKSINIITEFANDLPSLLELDKHRITQVLMNLVGNAIKFTGQKGKVYIRVFWTPKVSTSRRRNEATSRRNEPTKSKFYKKHEEKINPVLLYHS